VVGEKQVNENYLPASDGAVYFLIGRLITNILPAGQVEMNAARIDCFEIFEQELKTFEFKDKEKLWQHFLTI
jgi:hypothetical protein